MKIGLSTCGNKPVTEEHFAELAAAGISVVEISMNLNGALAFDPARAMAAAEAADIEIWSFHLPFAPFETVDIASTDEDIRLSTVELLSGLIRKNGACGIRNFIIHASGEPIQTELRRDCMAQAQRSLRTLCDVAESVGARILVEDLPRTCLGRSSWDILELLKADERLRVCFDTNHLLGEEIGDFIAKVGSRIASTHISDYDAWNERHWLPGEGCIDWKSLYRALLDTGYDGPWLYEIGYEPEWSIVRDRELTPEDFVRNAREIFEGKELTVIGKPLSPMTFWKA